VVDRCSRVFIKELLLRINKSMNNYVTKCGGIPVTKLLFVGGGSALKGLKYYTEEILDKPAYTVDKLEFEGIEFDSKVEKDNLRYFIGAIGSII